MSRTAYPVSTDVITFLQGTSIVTQTALDNITPLQFNNAVLAATKKFKRETGREFLAPAASTRAFDPPWTNPRGLLDFRADAINVTAVTINGSLQTIDQDYFLWPPNADADGFPWYGIELQRNFPNFYLPNQRKSVRVTAQWAFSQLIPDDVFDAIVMMSAFALAPALSLNVSAAMQAQKTPNSEMTFGQGIDTRPVLREAKQWNDLALKTLSNYKRVMVG